MRENKTMDMDREDRAIAQALERLDPTAHLHAGESPGFEDPELVTLRRQYTELLGLIPHELEPVAPRPEIAAGLLARIRETATDGEGRASVAVAPLSSIGSQASPAAGSGRWLLPLAAVLALVLVGSTMMLSNRLGRQQETIRQLAAELDTANVKIDAMADLQARFALVTQPGVEICALRPIGDDPPQPDARGALYVGPNHDRWVLVAEGLAPTPDGHAYQVWFAAADGPVSAGVFESRNGERIEVESAAMPGDSSGIFITLETREGRAAPTGDRILFGDEVMRVL